MTSTIESFTVDVQACNCAVMQKPIESVQAHAPYEKYTFAICMCSLLLVVLALQAKPHSCRIWVGGASTPVLILPFLAAQFGLAL